MDTRSKFLVPGMVFLVSLGFHLSLISKGPVSVDCLNLAIVSQTTIETHHLQYLYGSGYPLMVLLGSIFISFGKCIGITDPVIAVNFISVVFSSIAVLAFYFLVKEIRDNLTAVIASFILLLNPIFLDASTYGVNNTPAVCFLLLGQLSLLRFQTSRKMTTLLLSALCFGFMGATRLQDLILTFPATIFMFMPGLKPIPSQVNEHRTRHFLSFIAAIILVILLFHLPYFIQAHHNYVIQAKDYLKGDLSGDFQNIFSRHFIVGMSCLFNSFNIVSIICFIAGLLYTAGTNKRLLIFTVLWWMVPLGLFVNMLTCAPRYFNVLLPAIIIPISIYLAHMLRYKKTLFNVIASISCLIVIIQPLLNTQETFIRRHYHALVSDFYLWIGRTTQPDAIIISGDDKQFIAYYSQRDVLKKPAVLFGHLPAQEWVDFRKRLDYLLNKQKPVYITELVFIQYDHHMEFGRLMRKNYHLITVGEMPLELWYNSPFDPGIYKWSLIKIENSKGHYHHQNKIR